MLDYFKDERLLFIVNILSGNDTQRLPEIAEFSVAYDMSWHFGSFSTNHFPSVPKSQEKMVAAESMTFDPGRWKRLLS